jgi:pyruvate kinase
MYIAWRGLADSVRGDEIVYLSDGRIRLRVTATRPGEGEFDAVVEIGGAVASRQGLNIPGGAAALPAVPEVDLEHLRFCERLGSISSRCPSCATPMTSPPCAPTHDCR